MAPSLVTLRSSREMNVQSGHTGVDFLISIFCDFFPIFGEEIGVFSQKPMLWSQFLQKLEVVLSKKTPIFSLNFSANIFFKIITSVPGPVSIASESKLFE
jgi:hypothetical protein